VFETLEAYLRHRPVLLMLDNCEHVLPSVASLVTRLLQSCPRLTLLATSREALHVPGERVWLVPPLGLPDGPEAADLEHAERHAAIRLFAERAAAVSQDFVLGPSNAEAVVDICRRLDGLPLAIELAAARTSVLTAEEISARLDDQFQLLTGPAGVAHHHTLRAVCEWSHELLSSPEQALFRRLAVFAGGWTLEGAEAVCADGLADSSSLLELLSRLVDRSMVQVNQSGGQTRYRLLETLRQFAVAKLRDTDEEGEFRDRQLAWCVDLAERAEGAMRGPRVNRGLDLLAAEHDNLRAALGWGRGRPATLEVSLRLAGALAWYWWVREHSWEGIRWLEELLALADAAGDGELSSRLALPRVRALTALGYLYARRSDLVAARPVLERGLVGARWLGDAPVLASSLLYMGQVELG
jgi:non-specific serine/threonine protein kinase